MVNVPSVPGLSSRGGWRRLLISLASPPQWVPLDKSEGGVKDKNILAGVFGTRFFAREFEDQDSGNLTLNHSAAERRSTNHRFDLARRP